MASIRDIAKEIVSRHRLKKDEAEMFVTQMIQVIREGLISDRQVKIKGFGTFKLQTVKERASIDVNTGERVVIGEHDKVTFTPDNVMRDIINKPFSQFETIVLTDEELLKAEGEILTEDSESVVKKEEPIAEISSLATLDNDNNNVVIIQEEEVSEKIEIPQEEEKGVEIEEEEKEIEEDSEEDEKEEVNEEIKVKEVEENEDVENEKEEKEEENEESEDDEEEEEEKSEEEEEKSEEEEEEERNDDDEEDDDEEDEDEEEEDDDDDEHSVLYYSGITGVVTALLCLALGYYAGKQGWLDSLTSTNPKTEEPATVVSDTLSTPNVDTLQVEKEDSVREAKDVSNKQEESTELKTEEYNKDERVRTGAYVIVGTDKEVTVREGQTLKGISKAYLGDDMECYVEVYNNVTSVKAGDVIKIPKLKLKKLLKK